MDMDFTRKFSICDEKDLEIKTILTTVYQALQEKGYNPINQIVGYILSEDPTYITNHNGARALIRKLDRDELLQALVKYYLTHYGRLSTAACTLLYGRRGILPRRPFFLSSFILLRFVKRSVSAQPAATERFLFPGNFPLFFPYFSIFRPLPRAIIRQRPFGRQSFKEKE